MKRKYNPVRKRGQKTTSYVIYGVLQFSYILFTNKYSNLSAIRRTIILKTSGEKQHREMCTCRVFLFFCQVARITFFSIHLFDCRVLRNRWPPNELESCPFSREDILRGKFMPEVLQIRGQSNGMPGIAPNTVGCIVASDCGKTWTIYSAWYNPRFLLPNRAYRRDSHCGGFMSRSKSSWAN